MPIIGNPWAQDAGRFGQGVGNALSQGMLQLPQQRYMMALQQAQMQAQQQQQMQNYMLRMQQMQNTGQYQNQRLGIEQQGLDLRQKADSERNNYNNSRLQSDNDFHKIEEQNEQLANMIRLITATKPSVQGGMISQYNQPSSPPTPPINDITSGPYASLLGPANLTTPAASQGIQSAVNPGGWSMTQAPQRPEQPGQAMGNAVRMGNLYGSASGSPLTNNPAMMNILSNLFQTASRQALGQTNQMGQTNQAVRRWNPDTGQLE